MVKGPKSDIPPCGETLKGNHSRQSKRDVESYNIVHVCSIIVNYRKSKGNKNTCLGSYHDGRSAFVRSMLIGHKQDKNPAPSPRSEIRQNQALEAALGEERRWCLAGVMGDVGSSMEIGRRV